MVKRHERQERLTADDLVVPVKPARFAILGNGRRGLLGLSVGLGFLVRLWLFGGGRRGDFGSRPEPRGESDGAELIIRPFRHRAVGGDTGEGCPLAGGAAPFGLVLVVLGGVGLVEELGEFDKDRKVGVIKG